jgi:hypothetical protein
MNENRKSVQESWRLKTAVTIVEYSIISERQPARLKCYLEDNTTSLLSWKHSIVFSVCSWGCWIRALTVGYVSWVIQWRRFNFIVYVALSEDAWLVRNWGVTALREKLYVKVRNYDIQLKHVSKFTEYRHNNINKTVYSPRNSGKWEEIKRCRTAKSRFNRIN